MAPWSLCVIGTAVLLVSQFPEYSVQQSYALTIGTFLGVYMLARFVHMSILYPNFLTPLRHLPTPPGRSLIRGNGGSLIRDAPAELALGWSRSVPNNGLIRYYTIGNRERVLVISPKALGEVLVSRCYDFEKTEIARISLSRITGRGLLISEGELHKMQRKNLAPAFTYRHIKDLYPTFWHKAVEMVQTMESDLRKQPESNQVIRISDYAARATLDIIGAAGMGHDFGSIKDPSNKLSQVYRSIGKPMTLGTQILAMLGIFVVGMQTVISLPTPRNRRIRQAAEFIRVVARRLIREKKRLLESKEATSGVDILSVALTSGIFPTEESLVDQMMTFLAAGHETTSAALQWAIYALCKYPDIQARLRDEIRTNLPPITSDKPQPINASAIDNLTYLNAFCNEVLRFYPPVFTTVRQAARDTTIQGMAIPKGTILVLSPELTNHDPVLWGPDAGEFNPERWIGPGRANNGGADSNYSFLTFIHGPRSCIGQSFSKSELLCLVATMVGRLEFELEDPSAKLEIKRTVTMRPGDGVPARMKILDGW